MLKSAALKLDSSNMLGKVAEMPDQLRRGFDLGREAWGPLAGGRPGMLVVVGMGGSAMGGDLLRSYLLTRSATAVTVRRGYGLPEFVGSDALVVVSSYSGNTEEALVCLGDAITRGARVACITSGGELIREAEKHGLPVAQLPGGYPPRAALGYSFGAMLALAGSAGICSSVEQELGECVESLTRQREVYSPDAPEENEALAIAAELVDRTPLVYCSDQLGAVGLRWKNQFCENAKKLAFLSLMPEMGHNDVMGWEVDDECTKWGVLELRTRDDHPCLARRLEFVRDLVRSKGAFCGEYWSVGSGMLAQVFSLILLGDYASVFLALMRGVDPTPIATIDRLKAETGRGETER